MQIAEGWNQVINVDHVHALIDSLGEVLPERDRILRAFGQPLKDVKVVIVGQDPYPNPGHANGLAFSVAANVAPLPPSLRNIFIEYCSDTGNPPPSSGDLTPWERQGVLLLNTVLTVAPGQAGAHRRRGWEEITYRALEALAETNPKVVAILWGNDAAAFAPLFSDPIISAHPSPLSARRGFFGSRPFTRANSLLQSRGITPVEWRLP